MSNMIRTNTFRQIRTAIAAGLFSCAALAQTAETQWMTNQLQGIMANSAVGVIRNQDGVTQLMVRSAGVVTVPPEEWSAARFGTATQGHPDYSNTALLAGINKLFPAGPAPDIQFGGVSTGGDVMPNITSNGSLQFASNTPTWYFLSVTVAKKPSGTYGRPGTVLRSLVHPERAILSYYAEGNTGIDGNLVNATTVEQTSEQLGFTNASVTDTIEGLDYGIGVISVDPNSNRGMIVAPVRGQFYFTPTLNWTLMNTGHGLNPRTIYRMNWEQTATGYGWSAPSEAFTTLELFGQQVTGAEIDAISVYNTGTSRRVVFSTTAASGMPDELMAWSNTSGGNGAHPLKTPSGALVSDRLGLDTMSTDRDGVNGTCGTDPADGALRDGVIGFAVPNPYGFRGPLGLAACRAVSGPTGSTTDILHLTATGLDTDDAHVLFQVSIFGQAPLTLGLVPVVNDSTATIQIPGNLGPLGVVQFTAAAVDRYGQITRWAWASELNY